MGQLLALMALPKLGLTTVFVVATLSATLLPLGSEPVVFGLVQLNPELFWPAILVATVGNTLGGAINWWMGRGAWYAWQAARRRHVLARADAPCGEPPPPAPSRRRASRWERQARAWLHKLGPKACLLAWLPAVGDPICAVAGWMRLPFWPCVLYMALGKFVRYVLMTSALLWGFSRLF
ncbi:YqaA family protein [Amphibiibacter pelophylacis]|uniref:YqaA family protein n=1 Tax=Amphibiibacter pelophylacis TaxID=1799477 RepID=A0ACC6P1M1_9BURK